MTTQPPPTTLRKLTPQDHARWQTLWDAYTRFYEREPSPAITAHLWQRIHAAPQSSAAAAHASVHAIAAVQTTASGQEHIVGIAHYLPHENTSQLTPVCYLQDLYVDPAARASGVGKQVIDWLITECKAQNWSALYWNTRETNYRARALYDKYVPQSGFLVYRIKGPF
jgi:ribosomal protein S18 acetylase RimI-like enzyme